MIFFIALLVFILVYVLAKVLLNLVDSLKSVAEPLAVVLGALAALIVVGVIHI